MRSMQTFWENTREMANFCMKMKDFEGLLLPFLLKISKSALSFSFPFEKDFLN